MDTGIKEFIEKTKEKKKNDIALEESKGKKNWLDLDYIDRINFYLAVDEWSPSLIFFGRTDRTLFKLDKEDLEYLYNKYSKKVCEERDKAIEEVKNNYKDYC